jgi:hypothetical protein
LSKQEIADRIKKTPAPLAVSSSEGNAGLIVGIVFGIIGGLVLIGLLAFGGYYLYKRRQQSSSSSPSPTHANIHVDNSILPPPLDVTYHSSFIHSLMTIVFQ